MPTQVIGTIEDVYRWDNLYAAWRAAAAGKRGRSPAASFEFRLEDNLILL